MDDYTAPIDEITAALCTAGIGEVLALESHADVDLAAVRDVLTGFGELASASIAPTNRLGDAEGTQFDAATGEVTIPTPLADAFRHYVDGGWAGLAASPDYGGGGLPRVVATAVHEMFGSANMALSLNPMLTQSGIELLERWGDERQRETVLQRLVSGEWSGTMDLTEPDAGSDLSGVRTRATPRGDGRWLVNGTKIFITWGEHDLTDNIVHLVLARAPDAPAGIKGISLFAVGKYVIDNAGERNGVHCRSVEHKLGIHASPTCVIEFVDAVGELVGPLHGGMAAMFSMMNPARLAVGVQGTSIAERSYQQAHRYACERRQGRASTGEYPAPIIEHPDVQRMLLEIATLRDGARLLTYATAVAGDLAGVQAGTPAGSVAQRRVDLLTPVAKSWSTDAGERAASLALQVHGGAGFIEETGVAQHYRDIRIAPIYEGTNGIQAIDLVIRKVARDDGVAVRELLAEASDSAAGAWQDPHHRNIAADLTATVAATQTATEWMLGRASSDNEAMLAAASTYLELLGLVIVGGLLLRHAINQAEAHGPDSVLARRARRRAAHFAAHHLQRRPTLGTLAAGMDRASTGL